MTNIHSSRHQILAWIRVTLCYVLPKTLWDCERLPVISWNTQYKKDNTGIVLQKQNQSQMDYTDLNQLHVEYLKQHSLKPQSKI